MLNEALQYALVDKLPIFPLDGKVPHTRHGLKDATTDEKQIYDWWRRWPDANIGYPLLPGQLVVDIDPRSGGSEGLARLTRDHGPIPETLTSISGREDGGCHFFLIRPPGRLTDRRLPDGVDIRVGGKHYVVAPPSIHPATGRPYRWANDVPLAPCPNWLTDLIRVPITPPVPPKVHDGDEGAELVRFVAGLQEGNRNHGFYWACCKAVTGGTIFAIREDLRRAALAIGLTEHEVEATMRSAERKIGGAA